MKWFNEPEIWSSNKNNFSINADPQTDFWRITHDNGLRDNGHFYYEKVAGNFEATVKIIGSYKYLFDQAGLMVRSDEKTWLKCGIELVDDYQNISTVVTRDQSDWSRIAIKNKPDAVWMRLVRSYNTLSVYFSVSGKDYELFRQAYLEMPGEIKVGVMCAAPKRIGFGTTFEDFTIKQDNFVVFP